MISSNKPLVTTIIPVFNRRVLLKQSVDSVLAQSYRPIEIIIVNDGSDVEYLDYYEALASETDEVTLLSQANTGPGGARELGRQHASGTFIQYLDSDDILCAGKFEDQVSALQANLNAVACYGPCLEYKANSKQLDARDYQCIENLLPMRITGEFRPSLFPELLKARWWITSAPLYRRELLVQAGPWSNLINEEDWEYEARIASHGGSLCFVSSPGSVRLLHDDHLSSEGATDPAKLSSRAKARVSIYHSARQYEDAQFEPLIPNDYWDFFGRNAFLLARQCAAAGLKDEFQILFELSQKAQARKTVQHFVFGMAAAMFGLRGAATLSRWLGR